MIDSAFRNCSELHQLLYHRYQLLLIVLPAPANKEDKLADGFCCLNASQIRLYNPHRCLLFSLSAVFNAFSKLLDLLDYYLKILLHLARLTFIVTLIPPCRSRPRFNSFSLHFSYVVPNTG